MSLQVWLPLNWDLHNQGLCNFNQIINTNPTWTDNGKIGKAMVSGAITMPASATKQILNNQAFSFTCWIYVAAAAGSKTDRAMFFGQNSMGANNNRKFSIFQYPTCNDLHLSWMNDAASSTFVVGTWPGVFPTGKWTHLAIAYQNPSGKIYINGTQYATFSGTSNSSNFEYDTPLFGNCPNNGRYLNDYRIYDHCLSAKEVEEIAKGLVLHYKLDDRFCEPTTNLVAQLVAGGRTTVTDNVVKNTGENTDTYWYIKPKEALVGGSTYTVSCNCTGFSSASTYISFGVGAQSGANYAGTWKIYNGYNTFTFTMPTEKDGSTANFIFDDNGGTRTQVFEISNVQLEKKDHATPFVQYGTTRTITTIYDSSGYSHNGTIIGNLTAAAGSPRYETATDFPASGTNYIRIGTQLYDVKDEMTISLWAKANDWTSTAKGTPFSSVEAGGFGWQVSNANYVFYCGTGASSNTYVSSAVAVSGLSAGWHMLSATYDGLALRVYIDGELKNTVSKYTTKTPIFYNNSSGMFISGESSGNVTSPNGSIFRGSISDVRIYATALTADQIKEFYTTSMSIDSSGNVYAREFKEQ